MAGTATSCDIRNRNAVREMHNAGMDAAWIRDQLKANPQKSQRGLAAALEIDPSNANRLVAGTRQIKAHEIPKIQAYFGSQSPNGSGSDNPPVRVNPDRKVPVTREETVTELTIRDWPRDLPVLGSAACGDDGLFEMGGGTLDYVRRPPRLSHIKDAYGIYISGDSMEPWKKAGQLVYVHPRLPVRIGDHVVIQLKPTKPGDAPEAYIKLLVRRTENELRLLQYNPRKEITFKMARVQSIHRVMELEDLIGV